MNIAESTSVSDTSETTNLMVWTPGSSSVASATKTSVNPSYPINSRNSPSSPGSLLLCSSGFVASSPSGKPLLILLIATAASAPGIRAMFSPSRKKANTSLNSELVNSLYSSEAKTNSRNRLPPGDSKSNSRLVVSIVSTPNSRSRSASGSPEAVLVDSSSVFGPAAKFTSPVLRMIPELSPSDQKPAEVDPPISTASPTAVIPSPRISSRNELPSTAMSVTSTGPCGKTSVWPMASRLATSPKMIKLIPSALAAPTRSIRSLVGMDEAEISNPDTPLIASVIKSAISPAVSSPVKNTGTPLPLSPIISSAYSKVIVSIPSETVNVCPI